MKSPVKTTLIIISLLLVLFVGLYGLGSALKPLILSFAAAYLIFPLIKKIELKGFSRNKAIFSILAIFLALGVTLSAVIIPHLASEAIEFSKDIPKITKAVSSKVESLSLYLGFKIDLSKESIQLYIEQHISELSKNLSKSASAIVGGAFKGISSFLLSILNLFLIPLFFFYVINDFESLTKGTKSFIPKAILPKLNHYISLSNTVLSGYIRGQLMVAMILSILYATGLLIVGLKFGLIIGLFAGAISIIPYAGVTLGFATAILVGLSNSADITLLASITAVFIIVQTLESMLITPKFVGGKVGLSSFATMLALIIGGNLFGMMGMILGIPIAAIMKSALIEVKKEYQQSNIYKA